MFEAVSRVIEQVVRQQLSSAVVSVESDFHKDEDDVYVLNVMVQITDDPKNMDKAKMAGLIRHIRAAIQDDDHFPSVSFVSQKEAEKRERAVV